MVAKLVAFIDVKLVAAAFAKLDIAILVKLVAFLDLKVHRQPTLPAPVSHANRSSCPYPTPQGWLRHA